MYLKPMNRFVEKTVLLVSVFKWVILSTIVGIVVGVGASLFLIVLDWAIGTAGGFRYYYLLLPAAFIISTFLINTFAPDARGHGTEKVIEAIHKRSGFINAKVVPVKALATIITLAFGGSAGKEGPAAQIGSGLASILSGVFRLNDADRKRLVICGISSAFATVFGTPIAGAIFGVEVLYVGALMYDVLLPSFIAGIVASHVSNLLNVPHMYTIVDNLPAFSTVFFAKVMVAGVFFGFVSSLLIEMLHLSERLSKKISSDYLKAILGGASIILLIFLFSTGYLGLGMDTIQHALSGGHIIWYAFLAKILFTVITLSFGGSGGILTPIFFIGATAGSAFAGLIGMNPMVGASIGLVALLAGATNAPIAASIMTIELFGPELAPYAAVACVISFLITGHRSVYPSQIIGFSKSHSINFELGGEIHGINPEVMVRENSLLYHLTSFRRKKR
jgi:H+/Cl- antiporter ClcA